MKGMVECTDCSGSGKVTSWLEIIRTAVDQVRLLPEAAATKWHPSVRDPRDFDKGNWLHELTLEQRLNALEREQLDQGLAPQVDARADRVLDTRVQNFRVLVYDVAYETRIGVGRAEVAGTPPRAFVIDRKPIRIAQGLGLASAVACLLLLRAAISGYEAQHQWFTTYGVSGYAWWLALLSSTAMAACVLSSLRASKARNRILTWASGAIAAGAAFFCTALLAASAPSTALAREAIKTGDLSHAAVALDALRPGSSNTTDFALAEDELRLARTKRATSARDRADLAGGQWSTPSLRQVAVELARDALEQESRAAHEAHSAQDLRTLAATAEPLFTVAAHAIGVDAEAMAADQCLARRDLACAEAEWRALQHASAHNEAERVRTAMVGMVRRSFDAALAAAEASTDPEDRVRRFGDAAGLSNDLERLEAPVEESVATALVEQERKATVALEKYRRKLAAERARDEARRLAAEARERRREEREQRRALAQERAERWADSPLLCCDGETSPSCTCGGSHQGCCSHHGGVCGCAN
jgi:hypothetical protein